MTVTQLAFNVQRCGVLFGLSFISSRQARVAKMSKPPGFSDPSAFHAAVPTRVFSITPHMAQERRFEIGTMHTAPPTFELGGRPPARPPPEFEESMVARLHQQLQTVEDERAALVGEAANGRPATAAQLERLHRLDNDRQLALHRLATLYAADRGTARRPLPWLPLGLEHVMPTENIYTASGLVRRGDTCCRSSAGALGAHHSCWCWGR